METSSSKEALPGLAPSAKPKSSRVVRPRSNHPTYANMVREAITFMKNRKGSSRQAIERYVTSKWTLGKTSHTRLNTTLNRMVKDNWLLQPKGRGANGSFKINKAQDVQAAPPTDAPAAANPSAKAKPKRKKKRKSPKKKRKSPKKKKKTTKRKKKSPKKRKSPKKKGKKKASPRKRTTKKKTTKRKKPVKKRVTKKRKSPKKKRSPKKKKR